MKRSGLDIAELEQALGRPVPRRPLGAGEVLFHQGDAAAAVYVLEAGRLRLLRHAGDGTPAVLHTAFAGESFAEAALFSDVYHCDAVADTACRVAVFSTESLRRAMDRDPQLAIKLAARLARLVQSLRTQVALRAVRSAEDRVLNALRLRAGTGRCVMLAIPLKHLALEIGLTHEALYRALRRLEATGRLRRDGKAFVLGGD